MTSLMNRAIRSSPTVNVSLLSGRAIRGALVDRTSYGLVLRAAQVSDEDASKHVTWTRLDGDVVVPHEQIEFWQEGLDASLLGFDT